MAVKGFLIRLENIGSDRNKPKEYERNKIRKAMRIKARLATSSTNIYGYAETPEILKAMAAQPTPRPMYFNHRDNEEPVAVLLKSEYRWDEDLNLHVVEGEIELDEDKIDPDELKTLIESGGFSPSYIDQTLLLFEGDRNQTNICFYYDAYRTEEKDLVEKVRWLKTEQKLNVALSRMRRHAADPLTFIAVVAAEHLLIKFLEDISLYPRLKETLIGVSASSAKGKEIDLGFLDQDDPSRILFRARIKVGSDEEAGQILDELKEQGFFISSLKTAKELGGNNYAIYTIEIIEEEMKVKKRNSRPGEPTLDLFA